MWRIPAFLLLAVPGIAFANLGLLVTELSESEAVEHGFALQGLDRNTQYTNEVLPIHFNLIVDAERGCVDPEVNLVLLDSSGDVLVDAPLSPSSGEYQFQIRREVVQLAHLNIYCETSGTGPVPELFRLRPQEYVQSP